LVAFVLKFDGSATEFFDNFPYVVCRDVGDQSVTSVVVFEEIGQRSAVYVLVKAMGLRLAPPLSHPFQVTACALRRLQQELVVQHVSKHAPAPSDVSQPIETAPFLL
jgi:hypothetical protein